MYNRRSRSTPSQLSYTTSPFPNVTPKTTASSGGAGFSGYPPSPPKRIGSSDGSASPSPGVGRLKKANSGQRNVQPNLASPQHRRKPIQIDTALDEEEKEGEMVMVTYEEGLKKLGIDKPQHTIYPDPPSFNASGDIHSHPYANNHNQAINPPFFSLSSRPTPTTASLMTPGISQGQAGYRQYESPLKNRYSPQRETTPIATHRTNVGRSDEGGRFPTDSELMTTGIPSYYHDSSAGRYKLESPATP
jgi:hypothetical protein